MNFQPLIDNIIIDKNYEFVDDTTINVAILIKHVFRNFKEKQKYVKYTITFTDNMITFFSDENTDLYLKIPPKTEMLPVKCIVLKMNGAFCLYLIIKLFLV